MLMLCFGIDRYCYINYLYKLMMHNDFLGDEWYDFRWTVVRINHHAT